MSDTDSGTEGGDKKTSNSDSCDTSNNDSGSEQEGSKNDDDSAHSNRADIRATFRKLTDDAQKYVGFMENHDDSQNSNAELTRNVADGHRLVDALEMDTSEAAVMLAHAFAVAKAAKVCEKKCGRMDINHFTIQKYLKSIKATTGFSPTSQRQFNKGKIHELLRDARTTHSCIAREPLMCLLGAITIRSSSDATTTTESKTLRRASTRVHFDDTSMEQHEVVNSKVEDMKGRKDDPLEQSAIRARKLKDICQEKQENDLNLVDYGLYGIGLDKQVGTPRTFLQHVFDASVITRDGYAQVTFPAYEDRNVAKKVVTISDSQTNIRAANPPHAASTSGGYALHRFQQIISFNSRTVKNLLSNQPDVKPGFPFPVKKEKDETSTGVRKSNKK